MHRTFVTALSLVLAPFLAPAATAQEEDEESLEQELEELKEDDFPDLVAADETGEIMDEFALLAEEDVVFSAAKHEQDISESPSAITVITREQIENTHCTTVICLLRQVPEVDVRRVYPGFPVVGARALTEDYGNKALVLVDGREINLEIFGVALWSSMPVHFDDIERIEVIRGPGSALYGANAHSMVVSITTRSTRDGAANVFVGCGEHDRQSLHLRVEKHFGNWRLRMFGGLDTQGNWRIAYLRELEIGRIGLRVEHEADSAKSALQAGFILPYGKLYTQIAPMIAHDAYMTHFLLSHQIEILRAQISLGVVDTDMSWDLPLFYGETKLGDASETVNFFYSNLDADVQITWSPFDGNLLIAGGNYRWIAMVSEDNDPKTTYQHRVGFFLHDEQRLFDSLIITAGIRFDYNTITPFAVSPRVAVVWRFVENQMLRLAFGQAFRKPCFFETSIHLTGFKGTAAFPELGDFFRDNIGNEHLSNEKTTSLEAGHRASFLDSRLTVETDVFYALYRNTVNFQFDIETNPLTGLPDLSSSQMMFRNTGREVDSVGGSVSLTYRVKNTLRINANYTYRYSWYISEPPGGPAPGEGTEGERVNWEPAHLVNCSLHYLPGGGFRLGAALHGSSSSDYALPEDGSIFGDNIPVHNPPIFFISGFIVWRIKINSGWVDAGVRAFNLLNGGFRDLPAMTRMDGAEQGGELLGRRIFFFLRGSISL